METGLPKPTTPTGRLSLLALYDKPNSFDAESKTSHWRNLQVNASAVNILDWWTNDKSMMSQHALPKPGSV